MSPLLASAFPRRFERTYARPNMPSSMAWLAIVIRVAIVPVVLGSLAVLMQSQRAPTDVAAAVGLMFVSAIHTAYWWDPWRRGQIQAIVAVSGMVVINFLLLNLLGVSEPLLWLYPA